MIPRLRLSVSLQSHTALRALLLWLVVITSLPAVATAASRYAVSTDGLEVTDRQTGLIWRRCVEGMAWNGSTCAYGTTGIGFTWKQALERAASETTQSGKTWRVPNIKELSSIADRSKSWPQPQIDPQAFPAPGVPRGLPNYYDIYYGTYFWSSSPSVTTDYNGQPAALIIDFDVLGIGPVAVVSRALVRLVRDGQ